MTTYDSSVDALPKIMPDDSSVAEKGRKRPAIISAAALGFAALVAGGVFGGRKIAEARKPRSRWQQLKDRIR
ncbi:hypothetical protein [Actinoplanes couchii]|uniref:Uncharacterized protein n=1 Tax=Actinoplanes couchii TaxID=403638 RepID=A0ABQ3XR20_9ACTN|nr:hypothetical protein [Actinoplanes couchii]MDR6317424.1 hypothetical protein [Actinoplanes couchii]GID60957.1 hypothetical protein Aco03nite_093610 [Actinoplanes couchii]